MSITFTCPRCGPAPGVRTHCPSCLSARHPADGSPMTLISVALSDQGGWVLVHRCDACGRLTCAPAQPDDNRFVLVRVAVRPLASPPFPLEELGRL
ncbi:RNHCP domain-containing protein [Nonomuraea sp. NBC_01738]|uniref:RNHCP domain-containing protein n=1 Tax=Nonomuraea sp. NBC_01738 TaxID=2976003 RepID=UPI002E131701|nr:RNHCP domain-containing protein [Nonomuraea sp. NBC_01738]